MRFNLNIRVLNILSKTAVTLLVLLIIALVFFYESSKKLVDGNYTLKGSFINGAAYPLTPALEQSEGFELKTFGSWVNEKEFIGSMVSPSFFPGKNGKFSLMIAGDPNKDGNLILLRNSNFPQKTVRLKTETAPDIHWKKFSFIIPKSWKGNSVELVVSANSIGVGNWIAISEPFLEKNFDSIFREFKQAFFSLWILFIQFFYLTTLGVGLILLFKKWYNSAVQALIIGIIGVSILAYIAFWLFLVNKSIGFIFSLWFAIISLLIIIHNIINNFGFLKSLYKQLFSPISFWLVYSILCLSVLQLYGNTFLNGYEDVLSTANHRFFVWKAADNELPLVFTLKILQIPQIALWDNYNVYARPPLQTAFSLLLSPIWYSKIAESMRLAYQSLGILLQSSILLSMWCVVHSFNITTKTKKLVISMVVFSVFILINTVFVWPKLLSASYIFLAVLIYLSYENRKNKMDAALVGVTLALSILSHGGGFFPIIAISIIFVVRVAKKNLWKSIIPGAVIAGILGIILLGSWVLYSSNSGFPTNEQVKWHLGGTNIDDPLISNKSTLQAIRDGYSALSFCEIFENKIENLKIQLIPFKSNFVNKFFRDKTNNIAFSNRIIDNIFISLFYVLIVAVIFSVFILFSSKKEKIKNDLRNPLFVTLMLTGGTTFFLWILLMFGPKMAFPNPFSNAAAILHQGSYYMPVSLLAGLSLFVALSQNNIGLIMSLTQFLLFMFVIFERPCQLVKANELLQYNEMHFGFFILIMVSLCFLVKIFFYKHFVSE
jgi:hypothetical protein